MFLHECVPVAVATHDAREFTVENEDGCGEVALAKENGAALRNHAGVFAGEEGGSLCNEREAFGAWRRTVGEGQVGTGLGGFAWRWAWRGRRLG